MNHPPQWILFDTATSGIGQPVSAGELAAQKMRGWEKDGEPFQRMLNHECEISEATSRVHAYTQESLERDGSPPT